LIAPYQPGPLSERQLRKEIQVHLGQMQRITALGQAALDHFSQVEDAALASVSEILAQADQFKKDHGGQLSPDIEKMLTDLRISHLRAVNLTLEHTKAAIHSVVFQPSPPKEDNFIITMGKSIEKIIGM
jgi:hypothetical protein